MRYVIAEEPGGLWGHIVREGGPEIFVRFVYDRDAGKLAVAEQMGSFSKEDGSHSWVSLGGEVLADLEDSLKNANEDALDHPDYWGLSEADEIPVWADAYLPAAARL